MNTCNYDAIIKIRFLLPEENGRKTNIYSPYGCPLFISDKGFDCRFVNPPSLMILGVEYEIKVKFLSFHEAKPLLKIGRDVFLWEGKKIATGTITGFPN